MNVNELINVLKTLDGEKFVMASITIRNAEGVMIKYFNTHVTAVNLTEYQHTVFLICADKELEMQS